jgi:hypothetical protein
MQNDLASDTSSIQEVSHRQWLTFDHDEAIIIIVGLILSALI